MEQLNPMPVGPTRYSRGGLLHFAGTYQDGSLAVQVLNRDTAEVELVCTVCMARTAEPPPAGHLYLKDWSENEGIADALVASGVVVLTGRRLPAGYTEALEARLTEAALAQLRRQLGPRAGSTQA